VLISIVNIAFLTFQDIASTPPIYCRALIDIFPLKGETIDSKNWRETMSNPYSIYSIIEVTLLLVPITM
jgi:hypothetical protein